MLRPLGIGQLLDAAIKVYRARAKEMVVASALVTAPAVVLMTLVTLSAGSPTDLTRTDPATGLPVPDGRALSTFLGASLVTTVILLVATNTALAGTTRLAMGVYLGEEVGWRESLRFALRRFWSLTAVLAISGLGLLVGLALCIAPGVWLQGIWAVAVPALLVEELGATRSLGRSAELVRGRFWPVLGAIVLGSLLTSLLQSVLTAPVLVLQLVGVSFVATTLLNGIVQLVAVALTTPFMAALGTVIYVDLRVRKEGFDLMLLARDVGADAPVEGRSTPFDPPPSAPPWPGPIAPGG